MRQVLGGVSIAAVVGPLVGIVVWLTSRSAASGRIARNGMVGIRTRATQASDAAWQAGHRAAVTPALISFVLLTFASAPAWFAAGNEPVQVGCSTAVAVLVVIEVIVVLAVSTRAAHRAGSR